MNTSEASTRARVEDGRRQPSTSEHGSLTHNHGAQETSLFFQESFDSFQRAERTVSTSRTTVHLERVTLRPREETGDPATKPEGGTGTLEVARPGVCNFKFSAGTAALAFFSEHVDS